MSIVSTITLASPEVVLVEEILVAFVTHRPRQIRLAHPVPGASGRNCATMPAGAQRVPRLAVSVLSRSSATARRTWVGICSDWRK